MRWAPLCSSLWFLVVACSSTPPPTPPTPLGPGVTFTWPRDGQLDVPTRAPVVLHFSDALVAGAADGGCETVCIEGPSGTVAGQLSLTAPDTLLFSATGGLAEGTTYRVHARAGLLAGATNLAVDPLITFTTRQTRPVPGVTARVLAFNDAPQGLVDAGVGLPFLDVSTLRMLWSEPIDPSTVSPATVNLAGADGGAVRVSLSAGGSHLVVDPTESLHPGERYLLSVSGVKDLGGEDVAPFSLALTPIRAGLADGTPILQSLSLAPPFDPSTPRRSMLSGLPVNASQETSPLIGPATLGLLAGGLAAELGDPAAFGGPIPMVIRKGQRLDLSPLAIRFGGAVASGYQTSTLHFTILNDAVGFLTRNPLRPAAQRPEVRAPVFVDVTMDTVFWAEDEQGNALSSQHLMGVRLLGLSTEDQDQLAVEQLGALDLDTLGINVAPTTIALRLRTGAQLQPVTGPAPHLTAVRPLASALDVSPDTHLELGFSGPVTIDTATIVLTEGTTPVPVLTHAQGSTVVVTPTRRLAEGAAMKLTYIGITNPSGLQAAGIATDPLGGTSQLNFHTAAPSVTTAPPLLASVTLGAPCALTRATTSSPGACVGGQGTDTPYVPFELPVNRALRVGFTQPMRASTLVVGTSCGVGPIRVEQLDTIGTCVGVVPGAVHVLDRGFRFVPGNALKAGTKYRLVLVGGSNATCDANELCSRAGVPLNTQPLAGLSAPGGPNVVLPFVGAAPSPDSLQFLSTEPFSDLNGNGDFDASETVHDENRVAMEVAGVGGIVTSASLNGTDCLPARAGTQVCSGLHAELPVVVGALQAQCPIDATGAATSSGGPCLEVRVLPNIIVTTSVSMNTTAVGILPINDLPTHELVMRVREPGGPALGYILNEAGEAHPQFVIRQAIYLDAPDLSIAGGLVSHDVKSKPLDVVLKGAVTFLPDGRMQVALANLADVSLSVGITAVLPGEIRLKIPKGEMHVTLVGAPLR